MRGAGQCVGNPAHPALGVWVVGDEFPDEDRQTQINLSPHADQMFGNSGEGGMEGQPRGRGGV